MTRAFWTGRSVFVGALISALALGYVSSRSDAVRGTLLAQRARPATPSLEDLPQDRRSGEFGEQVTRELVLLYVGKASCAWSNHAHMPVRLSRIRQALSAKAADAHMPFRVIGVALDREPAAGLRHLEKFGNFDEVAAGGGWTNVVALSKLWDGYGGTVATPQLMLLEREIVIERHPPAERLYSVRRERLIVRKAGMFEIYDWEATGAALPSLGGK